MALPRQALLLLLQSTFFAMSQQDVRIYLNGLLLEFDTKTLTAVATDGHRMAIRRYPCESASEERFLLPRKGIQELLRILTAIEDETLNIAAGKTHFTVSTAQYTFSTQLVDARFPAYQKALPKNNDKSFTVDSDAF